MMIWLDRSVRLSKASVYTVGLLAFYVLQLAARLIVGAFIVCFTFTLWTGIGLILGSLQVMYLLPIVLVCAISLFLTIKEFKEGPLPELMDLWRIAFRDTQKA
jgi:hypothetical protein